MYSLSSCYGQSLQVSKKAKFVNQALSTLVVEDLLCTVTGLHKRPNDHPEFHFLLQKRAEASGEGLQCLNQVIFTNTCSIPSHDASQATFKRSSLVYVCGTMIEIKLSVCEYDARSWFNCKSCFISRNRCIKLLNCSIFSKI